MPDMPGTPHERLLPEKGEIKMRLYGQGLGDCFLLAFPRKDEPENPCYLVIDCGVAMSTPEKELRIRNVVENIHAATGGHIDILAITHQHDDHTSGFQDAWQEWQRITVDALYLPWTESTAATDKIRYFDPGDVFHLPGTECHGYVLGPPLPRGSIAFALSDDRSLPALASGLLAAGALDRSGDEGFCPFAPEIRLDWDQAMASPFFVDHYGAAPSSVENGEWRRIDDDWRSRAAHLALRAGDSTNNVSLVLAFDVPGSDRMLLFPDRDASAPARPPAAKKKGNDALEGEVPLYLEVTVGR
jgi:hypothetical protein